jgi:hypothetical protein
MTANKETQFKLMPIKYDLMAVNSCAVLSHIRQLTAEVPNISSEYMLQLCNTLIDRSNANKRTIFGYMRAPVKEISKQVIGKDGYFFKMTTSIWGIDFIWHDRENEMFLFWSPTNFRIVKAMSAIRWRINKYTCLSPLSLIENIPTEGKEGDADCYDMPPLIPCDVDYS